VFLAWSNRGSRNTASELARFAKEVGMDAVEWRGVGGSLDEDDESD
jgi:hypothetical protein